MKDKLERIRKEARQARDKARERLIDYTDLTAPCGLPCFECYVYLASYSDELRRMVAEVLQIPEDKCLCHGCRSEGGACGALPVSCRVYPCAQEKGVHTCCDCEDFPCDYLHPYADQALKPHNTKVYSLCLIKKIGLEKWAEEKAGKVLDTYFYEEWKL